MIVCFVLCADKFKTHIVMCAIQTNGVHLVVLLNYTPLGTMPQVVPMNHIRADRMREYCATWKRYKRVIGFRPTGWTFRGQPKTSRPAKRGPTSVQLMLGAGGKMVKQKRTGSFKQLSCVDDLVHW